MCDSRDFFLAINTKNSSDVYSVNTQKTIGNGQGIVYLPIKHGDFP